MTGFYKFTSQNDPFIIRLDTDNIVAIRTVPVDITSDDKLTSAVIILENGQTIETDEDVDQVATILCLDVNE